jgi:hypothetical protein
MSTGWKGRCEKYAVEALWNSDCGFSLDGGGEADRKLWDIESGQRYGMSSELLKRGEYNWGSGRVMYRGDADFIRSCKSGRFIITIPLDRELVVDLWTLLKTRSLYLVLAQLLDRMTYRNELGHRGLPAIFGSNTERRMRESGPIHVLQSPSYCLFDVILKGTQVRTRSRDRTKFEEVRA